MATTSGSTPRALHFRQGRQRVLVALVGLFRHHEIGFRALEESLIVPTRQSSDAHFSIALYTDPASTCSPKEKHEGRCCVVLPDDIALTARTLYGVRLVEVRIAEHSSHAARLADAWSHSLQALVAEHDATLLLRPDARLTRPLAVFDVCSAMRLAPGPPCNIWCQRMLPKKVQWTGHLACSPRAAAALCSGQVTSRDGSNITGSRGSQMIRSECASSYLTGFAGIGRAASSLTSHHPMLGSTMSTMGVFYQLLQCPGAATSGVHEVERKWVGVVW